MLQHLSVQNYALIDQLAIDFSKGLTIITGETGAGKSILLGALSLLVGQRADTQVLQDKAKKCVIEADFDIRHYNLHAFFEQHELDYEAVTRIRREINPEGKSRAFINDTPVTLAQLKELGHKLVDIHSQHETLTLNDSEFQLSVVDAYARHEELLGEYKKEYKMYKILEQQVQVLTDREAQSRKDLDYFQFQFNELDEANLVPGEQVSMEQELETLNHAEEIKSGLSKAAYALNGSEQNVLASLNDIRNITAVLSRYNVSVNELNKRLNSAYIELKDISNELEQQEQEIVHDPARMEFLNNKLDVIYRLQQKHQVKSVEELIAIKDRLSEKLKDVSSLEVQIEALKKEKAKMEAGLLKKAGKISANRGEAVPGIEKEIRSLLSSLGMPHARLEIKKEAVELSPQGMDRITFLFSANKGGELKELHKVASGGELSRLMLSIKSVIATLQSLPAIIFDEIDTGISGDVADKAGSIMETMARSMQVITITHLPQIASKGHSHLFVYKEDSGSKTFSRIKKLNKEERIIEIAKMLSTENPGTAAIKNAKELLGA